MSEKRAECAIAIMAKAPCPREVKTRLCPPLSYEEAAQLYHCFLLDKIEQLKSLKAIAPAVAYTPDDTAPIFEAMVPPSFTLIPQEGPDLGARLSNTLNQLLESGYRRVMAIDSDTPTLPAAYLERAVSETRQITGETPWKDPWPPLRLIVPALGIRISTVDRVWPWSE